MNLYARFNIYKYVILDIDTLSISWQEWLKYVEMKWTDLWWWGCSDLFITTDKSFQVSSIQ